ncbi:MAG TPA: NAD(P)-dependent oxidoreductase, partial [Candidatus Saccharimonadia bacterium]|nr:NAD(P)-dependent oxidoreductase [Candidatus Saccharimonadia bacterium]
LQARVLSYPDAHRYRLGVNDEALPVNRPHATAAHTYHRDGAMRFGANRGGAPSVIGLGNLGSQVATIEKAFGMSLVAWSQNLTAEHAAQYGAKLVSKDELLPQSDIVTIHLVLSIPTRGLIGARELGLMKRTAYLVNTSRGPLLEEPALIQALQQGTIAGAGLDVFDEEPLPLNHPFRRLENTVITPHLGYVTLETYRLFFGDAVEDMRAFLSGTPTRVINAPRG